MVSFGGRSRGDLEGLEPMFFALIQREASGWIYAGEGFSKARRDAGKYSAEQFRETHRGPEQTFTSLVRRGLSSLVLLYAEDLVP